MRRTRTASVTPPKVSKRSRTLPRDARERVGAEAVAELKSEASFSSSCSNDINPKGYGAKVVLVGRPTSNWVSHGDYGSVYMTTTIGPIPRHPVGAGFGGRAQLMNCLVVGAPPAATRGAI